MAQSFPDLKQIFLKRTRPRTAKTVRGRVCFFPISAICQFQSFAGVIQTIPVVFCTILNIFHVF